jgi:catechol 2,3-dioxygenase-like lactoylglutathione lyase family enzyme
MEHPARITSSVVFVSDLDRSVEFYRDVFSCAVALEARGAALLRDRAGFQVYLIERGSRSLHPSGGIGLQYLIWTVDSASDLKECLARLGARGRRADSFTSGDVSFVAGRDPDGIRVLIAHPSPDELSRSVVDTHLYA